MTEKKEVVLGHSVSLSCESNAIPPPKLSWYKDGRKLTSADGLVLHPGENCFVFCLFDSNFIVFFLDTTSICYGCILSGGQVLQIPRVRKEDTGKYTCKAVNEAGEDHMHFELEVLSK